MSSPKPNIMLDFILKHKPKITKYLLQKYLESSYQFNGKYIHVNVPIKFFKIKYGYYYKHPNFARNYIAITLEDNNYYEIGMKNFKRYCNSRYGDINKLLTKFKEPFTNREFKYLLSKYPEDAIISIEYCNPRSMSYLRKNNIILID